LDIHENEVLGDEQKNPGAYLQFLSKYLVATENRRWNWGLLA